MCGIAGIASFNDSHVSEELVLRMTRTLAHRGPDDEGLYLSSRQAPGARLKVGLGHKRLSIIDLESGHQPMANEDKSVWIVYNGEVYNFPELRQELTDKGYRFTTKSDTEVIIHLYEDQGVDCLKRLRGMFSLCIWDVKRERLFLARDRVGQKPLFYYHKDGIFAFGSEIKAILECGFVKRETDLASLDDYLTYGYAPSPATMFKDIRQLPPAHYMLYDAKGLKIERYWHLDYTNKARASFKECEERLYDILGEATKIRLISDVPVGAFLSGGVDSSCVTALMAKLSPAKVKTFSIGFDESDYDELRYAKFISERFGTFHREFIVEPRAMDILPKLAWHYDQPFGDSSAIPTYYVSKMTREFVTVALNGDGGDESFAGYQRYRGIKLAQLLGGVPGGFLKAGYNFAEFVSKNILSESKSVRINHARRFFEPLLRKVDLEDAYITWLNYFTDKDKSALLSGGVTEQIKKRSSKAYLYDIFKASTAKNLVEKVMNADMLSYLPEDLLVKVDRATMANSLEGRSPFLDHKVIEFAASIPVRYKLKGLDTKYILKRAFSKEIPMSFLNRRKKGFGVPVGRWFRGPLKDFVRDALLDRKSLDRGLFREDYIKRLLDEHQNNKRDHSNRIWALLSFEMWHRIFIEGRSID
ncbi:MAG: asparagine synthase (glutamine-hydrolyzing) [Candidatus Omnitrophota bacterium]